MQKTRKPVERHAFRYYDVILVIFIATLIISNIGSTKIIGIGPFTFDGGTIMFPLAYVIGDILTEVYGFKLARRAIWLGFVTLVLMTLVLGAIQLLPASPSWTNQEAFNTIVGFVPRIVGASITAYLIGEFTNTIFLSKLKVRTKGRFYWLRSLAASSTGEAIDTVTFSTIAFAGTMPNNDLLHLILTVYGMKLFFEVLAVPFSAMLVRRMKREENSDVYDTNISYSPVGQIRATK
jgi:uncharacterized integral membrane protein (TIGR00697 family)